MRCRGDSDRALGYLEGRLSPGRRARFEVHLRTCEPCGLALARVREAYRALREAAYAPVPEAVSPALTARVAWGIAPRRGWFPRTALVVGTVGIAAAAYLLARTGTWPDTRT